MKTLDYLHLDEKKVQGVVSHCIRCWLIFKYFTPTCGVSTGTSKGTGSSSCTASSKSYTTMLPKRPIRSRSAS